MKALKFIIRALLIFTVATSVYAQTNKTRQHLPITSDPSPIEKSVYFPRGAYTSKQTDALARDIAKLSLSGQCSAITIVGFSEHDQPEVDALKLANRRALTLVAALVKAGVARSSLNISWVRDNDSQPPASNGQGGILSDRATATCF